MKATSGAAPNGLAEGDKAPDFDLAATGGGRISTGSLRGRPYAVYFYPKADTPGCTKEACAFQSALPDFANLGLHVVGISRDPLEAIEAFARKFSLTFPLASDEDGAATSAYGVWVEKSMYGRTYMGVERATFLIDATGNIARAWRKVKVPGHAADVGKAAAALKSGQ